ncbi:Hemerythrin HHE cation binding domain-containing protein [Asanoa hainanensis]|uniref:Hemerythrin HHE cation binding domain-containing protein n=1 Tax=Asanoa hainanensis TaxID=560556 RepID=A0A239PC26_9ACTN|nr:hemerythrin domain-containing protein [Asanoa hainanensis]SNT64666.1 Hemerythrin HHE cation binding domain-containing protein [Asanoa hainanensis]
MKGRNPLLDELKSVHNMLKRDLAAVRKLADAAASGAPAKNVRAGLTKLKSNGPLFQLRVNCLSYCQVVHNHHHNEDEALFPAVVRAAPHLKATVAKLKADHRLVEDMLYEVEGAARQLGGNDAAPRRKLVAALRALSDHLLEHLAYEETQLGPVLANWKTWPGRR